MFSVFAGPESVNVVPPTPQGRAGRRHDGDGDSAQQGGHYLLIQVDQ